MKADPLATRMANITTTIANAPMIAVGNHDGNHGYGGRRSLNIGSSLRRLIHRHKR
jgi:hypothetical protein